MSVLYINIQLIYDSLILDYRKYLHISVFYELA
jgi:hypothetical protein